MLKHAYRKAARATSRFRSPYPVYWMEDLRNFGDDIGPWLVTMMTGRRVRNVRQNSAPREPGLMTVGSLITAIDRKDMKIWGSGLIRPLTSGLRRKLSAYPPARIYALRGRLTQEEIRKKLGWEAPDVFGDPAALLPDYYAPRRTHARTVSVVPHYIHKKHFARVIDDQITIVDVQRHPAEVIDAIAGSTAVLSTSLHGVICAQAYQVPWVWLQIPSDDVKGGAFKFEDYFTALDREAVSQVQLAPADISADLLRSISVRAALPKERLKYHALRDSLPVL